jgi:phytoene dehydrogenase-like protein
MSDGDIVIVGGGIAGLAAGCYARMNGYRATILEMHSMPGGLCAAWKRKGYKFDISMHMLAGSRSGPFHQMWRELGAVQARRFHYHSELLRMEGRQKELTYRADADDVEQQMLRLSPADEKLIKEFCGLIGGRSMLNAMVLTADELQSPVEKARSMLEILPFIPSFFRYGDETIQNFAERFSDPFLRRAVRSFMDSPAWPMVRFPLFALAGLLSAVSSDAGVPIGGSQSVVFDIADRFKALGGELRCRSRVSDVIVEDDRAAGVILEDGEEIRADTIIWAADGHHLIFDILRGKYVDETVRKMYETWVPTRPLVHVALGVARDMSDISPKTAFELDEAITVGGERHRWLVALHHGFDPTMAPPGKTALEVWYPTRYDYWEELAGRPDDYAAEKQRIAELTIEKLDERWPGFSADVEVVDVPTPATYVRYTGNWQGSPDGWYMTPTNSRATPLRRLPGLSDLLMIGQWTAPFTGTVMAALTGRQAVEVLCHRDRRPFETTVP